MKIKKVFKLIVSLAVCGMAGAIGSLFTMPAVAGWYAGLKKPWFTPPDWVFGPVWTVIYVLLGIALWLVWKNNWRVRNPIMTRRAKSWNPWSAKLWTGGWEKQNVIAVFAVQYILNIIWSAVFFGLRNPAWGFFVLLDLWFSIVYVMVNFYRISKAAAWLLTPYILWVTFAGYLNLWIWILNY